MGARILPVAVGLALVLAACGDDEGRVSQESVGTETSTTTTPTDTTPAETTTSPEGPGTAPEDPAAEGKDAGGARNSPEQAPGGAGDEIPASTQALFTGSGGRITPRLVRVPPFIAVRVRLRSGDGQTYELEGGGQSLEAPGGRVARPALFDGLRPGKRLVLRYPDGRVVVEASAEPGP